MSIQLATRNKSSKCFQEIAFFESAEGLGEDALKTKKGNPPLTIDVSASLYHFRKKKKSVITLEYRHAIQERLRVVKENTTFEIAALFLSPVR